MLDVFIVTDSESSRIDVFGDIVSKHLSNLIVTNVLDFGQCSLDAKIEMVK